MTLPSDEVTREWLEALRHRLLDEYSDIVHDMQKLHQRQRATSLMIAVNSGDLERELNEQGVLLKDLARRIHSGGMVNVVLDMLDEPGGGG